MNYSFWIAESYLLYFGSSMGAKLFFRWKGVQAVLWPVTLVVRAIARDPLRDPKPITPDYAKILDMERELGMPSTIDFREQIGLRGSGQETDRLGIRLEIGLSTTVTQQDLLELKRRTESSFDSESP